MAEHLVVQGPLAKLVAEADGTVRYTLPVGEHRIPFDITVGSTVTLDFLGEIRCAACGRVTKKSYQQGYCFLCTQRLAACDLCIVRPELCHFAAGTCRDPEWARSHCMQFHIVYLANASGLKVGVTRQSQVPTRWLDQGARQALPLFRTANRHIAGLLEVHLAETMADKTDWRRLLRGDADLLDLPGLRADVIARAQKQVDFLRQRYGESAVEIINQGPMFEFAYPVRAYPQKIRSLSLDATPHIEGKLQGIKGQYLLFDDAVLNIRKHTGYVVRVKV